MRDEGPGLQCMHFRAVPAGVRARSDSWKSATRKTAFPTGRKLRAGIVKFFPTGRKLADFLIDNMLAYVLG